MRGTPEDLYHALHARYVNLINGRWRPHRLVRTSWDEVWELTSYPWKETGSDEVWILIRPRSKRDEVRKVLAASVTPIPWECSIFYTPEWCACPQRPKRGERGRLLRFPFLPPGQGSVPGDLPTPRGGHLLHPSADGGFPPGDELLGLEGSRLLHRSEDTR